MTSRFDWVGGALDPSPATYSPREYKPKSLRGRVRSAFRYYEQYRIMPTTDQEHGIAEYVIPDWVPMSTRGADRAHPTIFWVAVDQLPMDRAVPRLPEELMAERLISPQNIAFIRRLVDEGDFESFTNAVDSIVDTYRRARERVGTIVKIAESRCK